MWSLVSENGGVGGGAAVEPGWDGSAVPLPGGVGTE